MLGVRDIACGCYLNDLDHTKVGRTGVKSDSSYCWYHIDGGMGSFLSSRMHNPVKILKQHLWLTTKILWHAYF